MKKIRARVYGTGDDEEIEIRVHSVRDVVVRVDCPSCTSMDVCGRCDSRRTIEAKIAFDDFVSVIRDELRPAGEE